MTISNLRCDMCNALLPGLIAAPGSHPDQGVRFSYHPGDPRMRDDSGVLCGTCWSDWADWLGTPEQRICAICKIPLTRASSLFVTQLADRQTWQLCAPHAADLLNRLRTVEPKFDRATFQLPLDRPERRSS
jgi:hypothetical protein